MTIPSAAIPAAPQALPAQAVASGKGDGDIAAKGFSQALSEAGFGDLENSLPAPTTPGASFSLGAFRNTKAVKQPPAKEEKKSAYTVPVMTHMQATLAPPIRLQGLGFSFEAGNREQSGLGTASGSASVAGGNSSSEGSAEKSAASQGVNANSAREIPIPPTPQTPQAQPSAQSDELAFAARMQPGSAPGNEPAAEPAAPRPVKSEITSPEQSTTKKIAEKDVADPVVPAVAAGAETSLASNGQQHAAFANPELPAPAASDAAASAAPAAPAKPVEALVAEPQAKAPNAPLKDISMQVSQPGAQKVDVRVVQQAGELRVAVHTGDSELAHGLQQGLPGPGGPPAGQWIPRRGLAPGRSAYRRDRS